MFVPSEFTSTQWSTTAEKADFGNTLLRFIEAGCRPSMFTKKLYNRLSNTFGHIAHYVESAFMQSVSGKLLSKAHAVCSSSA